MPQSKITMAEALASARETRAVEVGSNILHRAPEMFRKHFLDARAVIVADTTTFGVAGRKVVELFQSSGIRLETEHVFDDPDLYAEYGFVEKLEALLKKHDAVPIAVGSGVINDLTKLAGHNAGRGYMCVATAASMDGYTAFGASISYKGSKQTFNCPAPVAVLADVEVIRTAPSEMTASGYADLLSKVTAGADWILADALGVEPFHPQAWRIAQSPLRDALHDPCGARRGDSPAIQRLTEGLMLGGFAMQAAKSSRPASGAEHQFSHLWDMQHHTHNGAAPSHGFKVGIGTLAVAALYEHLFTQQIEDLAVDECCRSWPTLEQWEATVHKLFAGSEFTEKVLEETRAKYVTAVDLRKQLNNLKANWPGIKTQLGEQLMPFTELKQRLVNVGAPSEPEQIGISRQRLKESFLQAYFIRRRFTVLDVVVRAGILDRSLDALFGSRGVWPITK